MKKAPPARADRKYPPEDGDEPIDSDEEWEEREKKGRVKKKAPKDNDHQGH